MSPVVLRNLFLLALCQALFMTGSSTVLTVTALAGETLLPASGLATLPFSLQFVMTMAATIPASFTMRRFGRRAGFQIGAAMGLFAGLLNVAALMDKNFPLFCVGSALIGVVNAFALYYRFAAADCVGAEHRARAISLVLAGGVVAAFSGPNLARFTVNSIGDVTFAGCFAALSAIQFVTIVLLMLVDIPRLSAEERRDQGRPIKEILRIPAVPVAILAGMAGYSSMTLVMTSTPLAMHGMGHEFGDAAFVIQWHVFAMFAPAFVTGHLINRIGVLPVIIAGAGFILLCVFINHLGYGLWQFTSALVALGLGWNFMFVGGTSLLAGVVLRTEQAKIQGCNDFLVFGSVAVAALLGGTLYNSAGWETLNYAVLPGVLFSLVATLWLWSARTAQV